MRKNVTDNKVIGFYDEWGHAYCLKHGSTHNDCIRNEPDTWERCEVCGIEIIGENSDPKEIA